MSRDIFLPSPDAVEFLAHPALPPSRVASSSGRLFAAERPIEGDVKRHFSPFARRGRISRASSPPPRGLPLRLDGFSLRSVRPSYSHCYGFMTRSVVDAIRLLKLASRAGRQSANHGPI